MAHLSLEALEWEQNNKIRHPETLVLWLATWPQEALEELRDWLAKKEEVNHGNIQQETKGE